MSNKSLPFNDNLKNNDKGKQPMNPSLPSQNSTSPGTARRLVRRRLMAATPNRLRKAVEHGMCSKGVNSKMIRETKFKEGSKESETSSFDLKSQKIAKQLLDINHKLGEVDKLFEYLVRKFGPAERMSFLDSPSLKRKMSAADSSEDLSIEEIVMLSIVLYSGSNVDEGVVYQIRPQDTFRKIYEDYSGRLDTTPDNIRVMRRGKTIHPDDTAVDVGVEDGEMLLVKGMDPNFNTNTYMKKLTISQLVDDNPIKLIVPVPLNEKTEDIHRQWAEYAGYEQDSFSLVFDKKRLPRVGTVSNTEMKNGSKLFCVCYLNKQIWAYMENSDSF